VVTGAAGGMGMAAIQVGKVGLKLSARVVFYAICIVLFIDSIWFGFSFYSFRALTARLLAPL
jgi:hypothetical protein